MTQEQQDNFGLALVAFLNGAQEKVNAYSQGKDALVIEKGKRYLRIAKRRVYGGKCAYCFIDTTNGNVLKADSYKKPHPKPRSNIFDADSGMSGVDWHGGVYLR